MAKTEFTDEDLIVLFDGLWAGEDLRLDTMDADDLAEMMRREKEAKVVLQEVMDARGVESPVVEHLIPNVLKTVRPPSG